MQKNIIVIGIIWSILTVVFLGLTLNHDPSDTLRYDGRSSTTANATFAFIFFQFIPSIFVVGYYLKKKAVPKISYVILGLIYTWSFVILLIIAVNEEQIVFLTILLLIPIIGVTIWIKRKQSRNVVTKNNHIKNKTKTEKNNNYDRLKNEISEYQLKKEISEYSLKNDDEHTRKILELRSKETESKETESTQKSIADLLKLPESEILEFKSTLKWDIRQEKSNPELVMGCVKTIAGFLNNRGGILIVGYDDDNNIIYGLEKDYPFTSKKCNYDGWQQYFINQVNDKLGKTINHYFTIESISYDGKTLAKINVKSSPEPVFTKQDNNEGNFYVRIHGQTENLNPQETQKWISSHFKK